MRSQCLTHEALTFIVRSFCAELLASCQTSAQTHPHLVSIAHLLRKKLMLPGTNATCLTSALLYFDLANLFLREMSYGIMSSSPNTYMLIYQTTRTVQVLYFDGKSAAQQGTGQPDTQMLHIFGNVTGLIHDNRTFSLFDEYARAVGLCDWLLENNLGGVGWGVEGIVRMNAGFELIWCNFSSPSLRLISQLNVAAPQLRPSIYEG